MILFERFNDGNVHIAELTAVALVEDDDHMLLIDLVGRVFLDEGGQFLDGGDDDMGVVVLQLLFQDGGGGVAVGGPLFKAVIFLHGLVVQILPVHHKQHLVDIIQLGGQPGRLEGGQRLTAAGGVPDVAAALDGPVLLVVIGDLDAVQDPLGGGDLIGPHDHQHIFRSENAVPGQHIQNSVLGEEGAGEVDEVGDHLVVGVRPEGGELKAVAGLLLFGLAGGRLPDGVEPGGVGVVLGVGAVGDDKDLYILEQAAPRPEGVPLVAVDLVKCLTYGNTSALQFDMHKRQTINQYCNIITIIMFCAIVRANRILIDDLQPVVMDVLFIYECNILGRTVITSQDLDIVLLYLPSLFHNMLIWIGNGIFEKIIPFCV